MQHFGAGARGDRFVRITILTQYYPPEIGAPPNRLSELAKSLKGFGHSVTVLTAMPNYPTGKIYPGYSGMWLRETLDGIPVIRSFIYPTQSVGLIKRLSSYFSFVVSSVLAGVLLLPKSDILMTESPPLFLGMAGFVLSRVKRARFIFNISDLWPESAVELDIIARGSVSHRLSTLLELFLYRRAWLVSGQSKGILENISRRVPAIRTFHLSNGVDCRRFADSTMRNASVAAQRQGDECLVVYAGLHGIAQGLDQVLEAARELTGSKNVRFVLIGDGPEKERLQGRAAILQLHNVTFLPPVPASEIPGILFAADIVLVSLKQEITGAVPSKLYEAMAAGKPIVLIARGEAAEIIRNADAGYVVEPGNTSELVHAIEQLLSDQGIQKIMGDNGRDAAIRLYDRPSIARKFNEYLTAPGKEADTIADMGAISAGTSQEVIIARNQT